METEVEKFKRWLEGTEKAKMMWFEKAKEQKRERDAARTWARTWKRKAKSQREIIKALSDEPLGVVLANRIHLTEQERTELNQFLDQFGDIASGETLCERVENVLVHYINQMGRWVAKNQKR